MPELKFRIEANYVEEIRKWGDEHVCKFRGKYQGAIGGAVTYSFTNTSIGQIREANCACGQKYTIPDDL
jgi:hypothetical protein